MKINNVDRSYRMLVTELVRKDAGCGCVQERIKSSLFGRRVPTYDFFLILKDRIKLKTFYSVKEEEAP